ncbi:MAG: SPOR domain-containing protein [Terriglobales bacterium]
MATSSKDTEITLGAGRMLALFFTVVLVCAVFFAIGFSLGRKTSMAVAGNAANTGTPASVVRPPTGKDGAAKTGSQPTDFSFYKSVGTSGASTELAAPDAQAQPSGSNTSAPAAPAPASSVPTNGAAQATGGYFVQVAAVSREEDANALVEALKKKQYPAFAANNSSADKYYHVQVGPYSAFKDAEAMRARLIADGYNPILKK